MRASKGTGIVVGSQCAVRRGDREAIASGRTRTVEAVEVGDGLLGGGSLGASGRRVDWALAGQWLGWCCRPAGKRELGLPEMGQASGVGT